MKILFKNVDVLFENGTWQKCICVATDGAEISYVGRNVPQGQFDRVIDGSGKLLMPGLYNCHCHTPMSLFRGIGEDLPLEDWLEQKIYPAEERLNDEKAYYGTLLSCAEMIKNGIVSVSDMYFFSDGVVKGLIESGMKANFCRSIVSFDENEDCENNTRVREAISAYENYHNAENCRIKIDMGLHAEYTTTEKMTRYVAELAKKLGAGIQIHLSETGKEHEDCIARRGMTPTRFFKECGVFESRVNAAHCVHLTQCDRQILSSNHASIAHNPTSNLKLCSGIGNLRTWQNSGINVTLGTDGAGSNNNLDILKELNLCALLARYKTQDPTYPPAASLIPIATVNGAISQGRQDCGQIKSGYRADMILIDMNKVSNVPCYEIPYGLIYSASGNDVCLTMCDGEILYENGEFTTLDVQRIISHVKELM